MAKGKKAGTTAPIWDEFVEAMPMVDGNPRPDLLSEGETMWQNRFYVVFKTLNASRTNLLESNEKQ